MEDFIISLYGYAQEWMVPHYLPGEEYRRTRHELESEWTAFRATLTKEQDQQLDMILDKEHATELIEEQAAFCSALSIGISLGRL